jgi:hypothetical protein
MQFFAKLAYQGVRQPISRSRFSLLLSLSAGLSARYRSV